MGDHLKKVAKDEYECIHVIVSNLVSYHKTERSLCLVNFIGRMKNFKLVLEFSSSQKT